MYAVSSTRLYWVTYYDTLGWLGIDSFFAFLTLICLLGIKKKLEVERGWRVFAATTSFGTPRQLISVANPTMVSDTLLHIPTLQTQPTPAGVPNARFHSHANNTKKCCLNVEIHCRNRQWQ